MALSPALLVNVGLSTLQKMFANVNGKRLKSCERDRLENCSTILTKNSTNSHINPLKYQTHRLNILVYGHTGFADQALVSAYGEEKVRFIRHLGWHILYMSKRMQIERPLPWRVGPYALMCVLVGAALPGMKRPFPHDCFHELPSSAECQFYSQRFYGFLASLELRGGLLALLLLN